MRKRQVYRTVLPGLGLDQLSGALIVIEGADGSGRTTQIGFMKDWLETRGYAVVEVGLRRSTLVGAELAKAKGGTVLSRTTLSLFYATDFADQLENQIIPALRAGFIVLADRYIYTLVARDVVRGRERQWVEELYGIAIVPDAVFYLRVNPQILLERNFQKNGTLDYWESGMDMGFSPNMFDSFMRYQKAMQAEFARMQQIYGFEVINGNRSKRVIALELGSKLARVLEDREAGKNGG